MAGASVGHSLVHGVSGPQEPRSTGAIGSRSVEEIKAGQLFIFVLITHDIYCYFASKPEAGHGTILSGIYHHVVIWFNHFRKALNSEIYIYIYLCV